MIHAPSGATRAKLNAGRWHFQHGPIDLVIGADGDLGAVEAATEAAWLRFQTILSELVEELPVLRCSVQSGMNLRGRVAQRMLQACKPHAAQFITPMAAVAGAVADELICCFGANGRIERAYVNNGGDIALHLSAGRSYKIRLVADLDRDKRREALSLDGDFEIVSKLPVRGIATSGWRGRSFSLGIADSVTALAPCAADADAAATMIANTVDVDDPGVVRRRANELKDDTDLGERLVTVDVMRLPLQKVDLALARCEQRAQDLIARGLIHCAALCLQGRARLVGC